jgi:diguanylate cyclase (GGDEF)-like protein
VQRSGVFGLTAVLAALSLVLLAVSQPLLPAHNLAVTLPWWLLCGAYVAAGLLPIDYDVQGRTHTFTLTQSAMAIGLVFVDPTTHLLSRVASAVIVYAAIQRQAPSRALFNTAITAMEVTVATATAHAVAGLFHQDPTGPGPALSAALLAALILADVAALCAMQALFAVLRVPQTREDLRHTVIGALASTFMFTGVAIIIVAAVWSDVWITVIGAGVAGALGASYQKHRRLATDQQRTTELHAFIKNLGPLDLDAPGSPQVLQQVRALLHARQLDLAVQIDNGWRHYLEHDGSDLASLRSHEVPPPLASTDVGRIGNHEHMSAPLLGAQELVGVLTVRSRLGSERSFGLRDLRMLETLAVELATAIERGRLQRELAIAATTDALTHLPNLNESSQRIDAMLDLEPEGVLVAAVAVDSFREVNDTLGHQVGDDLLREVTQRLVRNYPDALIGRIGGGRFAVAMSAESLGGDLALFGLGLRAHVEGGAQLGPVGTHIKLSVGCVRGPEHGKEASTLIRRAETAMYSARNASGGPVIWEPAYEVEGQRRLAVVMALREALASGAIGVGFQPKVDTITRAVTGVEALARWTHPALGAISPSEFVPLAEASGLMGPLTSTVLRQALTACKGWQNRGGRIGVAVNVSAETILDPSFVTEVAAILTSINISPDLLTLELTEGVVVNDPGLATLRLGELRALGVKISVDDFGTGYSSLTYLKGLPVDEVKIDKAFVDGIVHDRADGAVVRAVVDIAHTLGLRVVAEGVEQEEQHQRLATFGVDEVQGFLHARPMAALDMAQWLRRRDLDAHSR